MPSTEKIKLLAFFLPQFHPTPENDEWWGKGFTEWTNVTKAKPLFDGHYQPHLPTDLGFYDLRLDRSRRAQIELAKTHGIDGFCYHYYWFSGRRLLYEPVDAMMADPKSDMPFCLCWANENWTRRWDAAEHEMLMEQKYLPKDPPQFIADIEPYLRDSRYIRIDGAPFLIVYGPQHLVNAKQTLQIWREHCRAVGLGEIHLCAALTHGNRDYESYGFDSGVEFPPHNHGTTNINSVFDFYSPHRGTVMDFNAVAESFVHRTYQQINVFRSVFPSWDNTARTADRAVLTVGSSVQSYEYWLNESVKRTAEQFPDQERFVFINAWNEWAEGCHLEPDRLNGHGFLLATQRVKHELSTVTRPAPWGRPRTAGRYFWSDIVGVLKYHSYMVLSRVKLLINRSPKLRRIALAVMTRLSRLRG